MTALIYAHSYCSSGTGHFAQFRDLKDVKSVNDTFLYRDRSAWDYFEKKFKEILDFHKYYSKRKHTSTNMDFREILENKRLMDKVDVIYADPPIHLSTIQVLSRY